jgi:phosphoribosyl 1,2-cyclic phosphate phosphodiesterase
MTLRFTILGSGSSGGVPRIGNNWGACDPGNPKNRRRRCAALVERIGAEGRTVVVIDTPPDIREQLLDVNVGRADAVLFTHDHADHTHGIDDLRAIVIATRRRVEVYMDEATGASLRRRFDYCFAQPEGSSYPQILSDNRLVPYQPVVIEGSGGAIEILPFPQQHGDIVSLGFRIGPIAYSPDISGLSDRAAHELQGLDVWIVDALRYLPHPSHWSVKQSLAAIQRIRPKRAILTHLHTDLDYETLRRELPEHVEPAYDGMVLEFV